MQASRCQNGVASQRVATAVVVATTLGLGVPSLQAGPCSHDIAQFEQAVRQSAGNLNAGPSAPQTVGAQTGRQPTPGSIKQADERAKAAFEAALARSKRLDARGDRAGCTKALARAEGMYNLR